VVDVDVPDQRVVAALTRALAAALTTRMTTAGWSVDRARRVSPVGNDLPAFRSAVGESFSAVAEFNLVGPWSKGDPPVKVVAQVAVDYEPAYRLAPHVLGRESYSECEIDAGDLLDPPLELTVTMSRAAEAEDAAEQLLAPILSHATAYARAHSTIEDMLDSARSDPEQFHHEIEQVPLLLAAAGRHDEARAALARYLATGEWPVTDSEYRRFARQLTLWMDAGGVLPDPPTGPVRPTPGWSQPRPSLRDAQRKSRARREAFDAVRDRSAGKTRDELRVMLKEEYERRDVEFSQLMIETSIDAIEQRQTPLGTFTARVQGVALAANLGWRTASRIATLVKVMRGADLPDRTDPVDWLEPPEEAAYPVTSDRPHGDWMTVELDDDTTDFLRLAHAAIHPALGGPAALRPLDTVILEAWLSPEPAPASEGARLLVHLGQHAVGALTPTDAQRYAPVIAAAGQRQELPRMTARLTTFSREPHLLLEIEAPARA
jgi:hypothetical protein